jgi:hypothetical protein
MILAKLRVYPLWKEDVFRDILRLGLNDRGDLREGSVCSVSVNGRSAQLIVRGSEEALAGGIMFDEYTRRKLGSLQEGMTYEFTIRESGVLQQVWWACNVADRGARISAWIGIISIGLGVLGAILGGVGLYISMK